MDIDNDRLMKQYLDEAKTNDLAAAKKNLMPMYVSQSKKMAQAVKQIEQLQKSTEEHNKIILKHEQMLRECLTFTTYNTKNQIFKGEMESNFH